MRRQRLVLVVVAIFVGCQQDALDDDTDAAPACGNLVIDDGESCDGMTTATCEDVGHNAGTPRCTQDCQIAYDTCETLTPIAIDHARNVSCTITEEQGLSCWGSNLGGLAEQPAYANRLHGIDACEASQHEAWCGLTDAGKIVCRDGYVVAPEGEGYSKLGCRTNNVWAVSRNGALEFGNPSMTRRYDFIDGHRLQELMPAIECGLYNDGTVVCRDPAREALFAGWHVSELRVLSRSTIDGDRFIACGVTLDGTPGCLTDGTSTVPSIPESDEVIVEIMPVASTHEGDFVWGVCLLEAGGTVLCDDHVPWRSQPSPQPQWSDMRAIAMRCFDNECGVTMLGIDSDGNLHRFGDSLGWLELPGPYVSLPSAEWYELAVKENGDVISLDWHQDPQTQTWTPSPRISAAVPTYADVTIGGDFIACGTQTNGHVDCWGRNAQDMHIRSLSPATEVVASPTTLCSRQPDDTFTCIGQAWNVPDMPFRHISGTPLGSCFYGVDFDGQVHHWGTNPQLNCPLPAQTYHHYNARLGCGITTTGDIDCWDSIIPGPWRDMRRAGLHDLCALGTDGYIKCFSRQPGQELVELQDDTIPAHPVTSLHGDYLLYALSPGRAPIYIRTGSSSSEDSVPAAQLSPWTMARATQIATNPAAKGSALCTLHPDSRIRCSQRETAIDAPGAIAISRSGYRTCYQVEGGTTHCLYDDQQFDASTMDLELSAPLTPAGDGSFCSLTSAGYTCFPTTETATFAHLPEAPGPGILRGGERGYCFAPQSDVAYCFTGEDKVLTPLDSRLRIIDPGHNGPQDGSPGSGIWLVCGISQTGALVCAGEPDDLRLPPPDPDNPFVDVQVEGWHACAQRQSGEFACFGRYEDLASFPTPAARDEWRELRPLDDDEALHIGSQVSCRFSAAHGPRCWGQFSF